MKDRTRYVFGAALASLAIGGIPNLLQQAEAAIVTAGGFTFESATVAGASSGSGGFVTAEVGVGTGFGFHAASSTYSTPAGNGSPKSYSSNGWAVNDYYQFSVPTSLLSGIMVSFDQVSSSTGPKNFTFFYSADGTNFSSVGNYAIPYITFTGTSTVPAGSTSGSSGFSSGASNTAFSVSFDLSGITTLDNAASAAFRILDNSTVSLNGGTVASTGTDRVDNFVVTGNNVPEPATLSVVALSAAGMLARRRRSN